MAKTSKSPPGKLRKRRTTSKPGKPRKQKLKIAIAAWEIGRTATGLGTKIGGLGTVMEELPEALLEAAAEQNIDLDIEILSPWFGHYDPGQRGVRRLKLTAPAVLAGRQVDFKVFQYRIAKGLRATYFSDDWQLHWTNERAIYPTDPVLGLRLYGGICQAMASYIRQRRFQLVHAHDYHVGLIPFYLGDEYLRKVPFHFTVHNASYHGECPSLGDPYGKLFDINLPGFDLFHLYFDFFGQVNQMKAALIKTHHSGGRVTTVSGDSAGTWGYAAELREDAASLRARAQAQKWWGPVGEIFLPNRHLDVFEKIPIAGITNGMSDRNLPSRMPELNAGKLKKMQARQKLPLFRHPTVQLEMLDEDHHFDADHVDGKSALKRLLHLEAFGGEPAWDPILITAVGRLVSQKNLGLITDVAERVFAHDPGTKFVVMATPGDDEGSATQAAFRHLAAIHPDRFFYIDSFNRALSRLILAGADFSLVPSRFEPCGLVDYESSLLGTVVVGRRTGGISKVGHCAYLYDWLDISDREGEAGAFFDKIREAIDVYRYDPQRHRYLMRTAMQIDASWASSARKYIDLYRYGLQVKQWRQQRRKLVKDFARSLKKRERSLFEEFLAPGAGPFADQVDQLLRRYLDSV